MPLPNVQETLRPRHIQGVQSVFVTDSPGVSLEVNADAHIIIDSGPAGPRKVVLRYYLSSCARIRGHIAHE